MQKLVGFVPIGILLLITTAAVDGSKRNEDDHLLPFKPDSTKRAECGGTFRSDENTLSFPGIPGETLIGGETCVWTIHLESTRDFRFNFTQFDVNSGDAGCSSAGVRLYSLSNLVPPGELPNELFCSERPPSDSGFYLGGTVAALVVYSTPNNSDVGSGFTLAWKGASFDPLLTKHVSSFSTVESGVVSYPVAGTYEPNLVATWAVTTEAGRKSDLLVEQVGVEECPNSDPCTCDALILYEVEERGVLSESARFCTNSSVSVERVGVADRFLLAFFTDFNESPGGTGFSAKYVPTSPTTPPTTEPTTPEPEPSTPCGKIFTEPAGVISYHVTDTHPNYARCVWTLQNNQAVAYKFNLTDYFVSGSKDGLLISTLPSYRSSGNLENATITNLRPTERDSFTVKGDVAILTFYSDRFGGSRGFKIHFEAELRPESDPRSGVIAQESSNEIDYPLLGPNYQNLDLATFIFTPNFTFNEDFTNFAEYRKKGLEENSRCYDRLIVYKFVPYGLYGMQWVLDPSYSVICHTVDTAKYNHDDMLLFVFKTDFTTVDIGFELNFYTKSNGNSTTTAF